VKWDRTQAQLTMLSYILKSTTQTIQQMKIPSFRKDNEARKARADTKFVCKECKMVFHTKDSLELHKRKSRHFTGLIYFGKHEK
jgi:hypothetical protein